jgi:hypothetical protein
MLVRVSAPAAPAASNRIAEIEQAIRDVMEFVSPCFGCFALGRHDRAERITRTCMICLPFRDMHHVVGEKTERVSSTIHMALPELRSATLILIG